MKRLFKLFKKQSATPIKFILISTQRSGTTYLGDLLNSHPDIYMGDELFKLGQDKNNIDNDNYKFYKKDKDVITFLNDFYKKRAKNVSAVGFKIMLNHLEEFPEIIDYIKNKNIKCIYLERENYLKIALSRFRARSTKLYHTTVKPKTLKLNIDTQKLFEELDYIDKNVQKLRTLSHELHAYQIKYENINNDTSSELSKLLHFLQVKNNIILQSSLQKINSDKLSAIIENYDEVKSLLFKTDYAVYLD